MSAHGQGNTACEFSIWSWKIYKNYNEIYTKAKSCMSLALLVFFSGFTNVSVQVLGFILFDINDSLVPDEGI